MRRRLVGWVVLLCGLTPSFATGQDAARIRLEREAAGQAEKADALLKAGQHAAGLKLYRAERESRKALGDARYEATALRGIGCCLVELGDFDGAIEAFTNAREIDAGRDDKGFEGYDGLLLAKTHLRKGQPAETITALEKAIPKLDQAIDRDHECDALICLLTAKLRLGQPEKGQSDATRAIALAESLDDGGRLADAWLGEGLIAQDLGHLSLALERIQDARDAFREQNRLSESATATKHLASLSYRLGRRDRAAHRFEEAIALHVKLGDRAGEADGRLDLATIRLELGDADAAAKEASLARDAFSHLGDDASEIEAIVVLAQARSRGKAGLKDAVDLLNVAIDRSAAAHRDQPAERVRLYLLAAELEARLSHSTEVVARLNAASQLADKAGDPSLRDAVSRARAKLAP